MKTALSLAILALLTFSSPVPAGPGRVRVDVETTISSSCAPDDGPAVDIEMKVSPGGAPWTLLAMIYDEAYQEAYSGRRDIPLSEGKIGVNRSGQCSFKSGRIVLDHPASFTDRKMWTGALFWDEDGHEISLPFNGQYRSVRQMCG